METFQALTTTVDVPTVRDVTRIEFVVNPTHLVDQDIIVDGEVVGTVPVDDGGPDLDIFVYVGGSRSEHRRQVPRAKVILGWPGDLRAELVKVFNNAE